jgi:hypothetical protein
MLIGDKTGPAMIAHTYGDVRPDHLLAQARRIQFGSVAGSTVSAESSAEVQSGRSATNRLQDAAGQSVNSRSIQQSATLHTIKGSPINH